MIWNNQFPFKVLMLPNQTWVGLPALSKADLPTLGMVQENAILISGSKQGVQYLVLKRPELPSNF